MRTAVLASTEYLDKLTSVFYDTDPATNLPKTNNHIVFACRILSSYIELEYEKVTKKEQ